MIAKINKYELTLDADHGVFKRCGGIRVGGVDDSMGHTS
jgi:hypothetical protein